MFKLTSWAIGIGVIGCLWGWYYFGLSTTHLPPAWVANALDDTRGKQQRTSLSPIGQYMMNMIAPRSTSYVAAIESLLADLASNKLSLDEVSEKSYLILDKWAREDLLAVVQWLETRRASRDFETLGWQELQGIFIGRLVASNESLVEQKALSLPPSNERSSILSDLLKHKLSVDSTAATNWLKSIQDTELRTEAVTYTLKHQLNTGEINVKSALTLLKSLEVESKRLIILQDLVINMSDHHAEDFAANFNNFSQQEQSHLLLPVATTWANSNQDAATAWVIGLAPSLSKDIVLADLSERYSYSVEQVGRGLMVANQIVDPLLRQKAIDGITGKKLH